ncbi:MAG: UDP-N-acetylmuramoyl-tripeptide--D-alanyl-D-alanine ligase [Sedimentisphaerales bacterium]|nr:UDP-N-acetylmuramoyl-tripeptide--D-alanyl-D-alanine ligase [Sedimentisphaerales bacterium]
MITFSSLQIILNARSGSGHLADITIGAISTDTRTIRPGDCFFAISGPNFDGHDYVGQAFDKGAICAVVQRDIDLPPVQKGRLLIVKDTIKALGQLAAWYRSQLQASVVAITGSAGKTTTRHITYHVLSKFFSCHQATNSFNNHIGLPLTILAAQPEHQIMLLELGTNHPGEIGYLTRIARPDIALVTCAVPAHLEGFGSVDHIIREKLSISEGLTPGGLFIVNGDQPEIICNTMSLNCPYLMFGTGAACDFQAQNLKTQGNWGELTIEGLPIRVPMPGRANLMNALAAWAICQTVGISLSDFANAIGDIEPVAMRMNIETIGPIKIIIDCYNANPASMANALDCLNTLSQIDHQRAVFVAGCMAELGPASRQLHYELGQKAVHSGVQFLLAAGPFASDIIAGATYAGLNPARCKTFPDTQILCDNLHEFVRPADIVLVKGSRSAGMEKAVEQLRKLYTR